MRTGYSEGKNMIYVFKPRLNMKICIFNCSMCFEHIQYCIYNFCTILHEVPTTDNTEQNW